MAVNALVWFWPAPLFDIELVDGPALINHWERQRAITIEVTPPETMPLQTAMETVEDQVLGPMRSEQKLGGLYRAHLSGTADKLTQTRAALQWNFVLAVVITYLLMAALFESFLHPLVILFSVPLAALGGFLGLAVVNLFTYQALDVLTFTPKKAAFLVGKTVKSAIANAENNEGADVDELKVASVQVNEGPTMKRGRARAKGRGTRILKRNSHITVTVGDK